MRPKGGGLGSVTEEISRPDREEEARILPNDTTTS